MNYYNQKCPGCHKVFTKDDDIVVCPVCGTPQHRECYEKENRCVNYDKHSRDYVWSPKEEANTDNADNGQDYVVCSNCGAKNSSEAFFCGHCAAPLNGSVDEKTDNRKNENPGGQMPFTGIPFAQGFDTAYDEDEIADNVKLKEAKAYVKTNTLLYSFVFKNIHDRNRSRFNFAAFLFSGGWFLYRKQYGIGIVLTLILAVCMVGYDIGYMALVQFTQTNSIADQTDLYNHISSLPLDQALLYVSPLFFRALQYIVMIISGFIGNRCYYKNVVKKVRKTKAQCTNSFEVNKELDRKGGVDRVLGYVLLAGAFVLTLLPNLMLGML